MCERFDSSHYSVQHQLIVNLISGMDEHVDRLRTRHGRYKPLHVCVGGWGECEGGVGEYCMRVCRWGNVRAGWESTVCVCVCG